MNFTEYKEQLMATIKNEPETYKRDIVNGLINDGIASRNKKDEGKVYVRILDLDDKIEKCIIDNDNSCKYIEKYEMLKGYKYSIIKEINNINIEDIKQVAIDINTEFWREDLFEKPLFYEESDFLVLKFHKIIDIIDQENGGKNYVRYPLVVVIHKKLNILEYRFDKITHKKDENFYSITIKARQSWMSSKLGLRCKSYELGNILNEITTNKKYKQDVREAICSLGFAGDKGVIVKYGEDEKMPFIEELEDIIKNNKKDFSDKSISILNDFIFEKKVLSSKYFRELKWLNIPYNHFRKLKDEQKIVTIRCIFNYKGKCEDLLVFYNSKYNYMERMNYVVEYFRKVENQIK